MKKRTFYPMIILITILAILVGSHPVANTNPSVKYIFAIELTFTIKCAVH